MRLVNSAISPVDRRVPKAAPTSDTRLIHWIVPVIAVAVLLVISLLTLPVDPRATAIAFRGD